MGVIDRVKNILLTPKTEWPVIAGEAANAAPDTDAARRMPARIIEATRIRTAQRHRLQSSW